MLSSVFNQKPKQNFPWTDIQDGPFVIYYGCCHSLNGATLFFKVDSTKLWDNVKNEIVLISVKFGANLINTFEVTSRKTNRHVFEQYVYVLEMWSCGAIGVRGSLPYLTLPSGWAGCYTCPALRPHQFGPMRNPDVTRRSQWSAVKPNKSPATWDWWRVAWLFLSGGLRLVSSSPSD